MDASCSSEEGSNRCGKKICDGEDKLTIIRPLNYRFNTAVDNQKYNLADIALKCDKALPMNVAKMAKRITAQINPHTFGVINPILIFGFMKHLKPAGYTNGIQEMVDMWFFDFFMTKSASAVLRTRLSANATIKWSSKSRLLSRGF